MQKPDSSLKNSNLYLDFPDCFAVHITSKQFAQRNQSVANMILFNISYK